MVEEGVIIEKSTEEKSRVILYSIIAVLAIMFIFFMYINSIGTGIVCDNVTTNESTELYDNISVNIIEENISKINTTEEMFNITPEDNLSTNLTE